MVGDGWCNLNKNHKGQSSHSVGSSQGNVCEGSPQGVPVGPGEHPHTFLANSITINRLRQTGNSVPAQSLSPGYGGFAFALVVSSRGAQVCVFLSHHGRVSCTVSSHYMFSERRLS